MSIDYTFYMKTANKEFYPIASFGGSSMVGEALNIQFGSSNFCNRRVLHEEELRQMAAERNNRAREHKAMIRKYQKRQEEIGSWTNSTDEKYSLITELDDMIDEEKCDMDYCTCSANFFEFLLDFIDMAKYASPDDPKIDPEDYIYWEMT